jgi:hypothetical protein
MGAQIQKIQASVSGHPMLRQVSHTTPSGVSHMGHQSSGRRRWRSITCTAPNPSYSRRNTARHLSLAGSIPGILTRFHTMLVAPQPWLSLTPSTTRSRERASRMTESRSALVISLALGEALTISKPSRPAATRVSRRSQWFLRYSGKEAIEREL